MSSAQSVAIVTGASGGIGLAFCHALLKEGYAVVMTARQEEKLKSACEAMQTEYPASVVHMKTADLREESDMAALVAEVLETFERVDVLVNNAGAATLNPIQATTADQIRLSTEVNINATAIMTHLVWPTMMAQKSGMVINLSSMAAKDPFPGFFIYAAAKAGVNMLTLVTGREGRKYGIRAVGIGPGAVETEMLRSMFNEKMVPASKTLEPADIAALGMDCLQGRKDFGVGETLYINK